MDEMIKNKVFLMRRKGCDFEKIGDELGMNAEIIKHYFTEDAAFRKDYEDYGLMFIKGAR